MDIAEAQADVRGTYHGGFFGQLVAGAIWLLSAAASVGVSPQAGMVTLLAGGILIFPLTTLLLRFSKGPASLPPGHPMAGLAMQIAFTVPVGLLVALGAAGAREEWFFPASMMIVGAHYLPFTFLYGMPQFTVLGGLLSIAGVALALMTGPFSLGGWFTGVLLIVAAFVLRASSRANPHPGRNGQEPPIDP